MWLSSELSVMVSLMKGTKANRRTDFHSVLVYYCIFSLWLLLIGRPVMKKLSWMANNKRAYHIPDMSNLGVCALCYHGV